MKKLNWILLGVLIVGLVGVYLFDELAGRNSRQKELEESLLFNPSDFGKLREIVSLNSHLIEHEGGWYVASPFYPVDGDKLNQFFDLLAHVRAQKNLGFPANYKDYFLTEDEKIRFVFEKGEITYVLGKKLNYDQTFYLGVRINNEEKIVIAEDTGAMPEVYKESDAHRSLARYDRFRSLLFIPNSFFYNSNFLKQLPLDIATVDEIYVSSSKNSSFSIFPSEGKTEPLPFAPLKFDEKVTKSFIETFKKIRALTVFPDGKPALLKVKLAEIILKKETMTFKLALFQKYNDQDGLFLSPSFDRSVYELDPKVGELLFQNVQFFWERTLPLLQAARSSDVINLSILFQNSYHLVINLKEKFQVGAGLGLTANNEQFKKLFDLLVSPADYVEQVAALSAIEEKRLFTLELSGQFLDLFAKGDEILVLDRKSFLLFHYLNKTDTISAYEQDYISKRL